MLAVPGLLSCAGASPAPERSRPLCDRPGTGNVKSSSIPISSPSRNPKRAHFVAQHPGAKLKQSLCHRLALQKSVSSCRRSKAAPAPRRRCHSHQRRLSGVFLLGWNHIEFVFPQQRFPLKRLQAQGCREGGRAALPAALRGLGGPRRGSSSSSIAPRPQ